MIGERSRAHGALLLAGIGGNISPLPYSCALRAGGSYNYLLVNGIRRLTGREMLRLQGFPDSFKINVPYSQARKIAGNSVTVPKSESGKFKTSSKYIPQYRVQCDKMDVLTAKMSLDKIIKKARIRQDTVERIVARLR